MGQRKSAIAAWLCGVLLLAACASTADTEHEVAFYHDKNEWGPLFEEVSMASAGDIGLGLNATNIPQTDNYVSFVYSSMMTDQRPDLFTWQIGPDLEEIVANGSAEDLTDLWDEGVARGDLEEQLREFYTIDGREYAVPLTVSYWVMFYRTEVFDDLGVEPPTTWEELEDVAQTALDAGITPFNQTGGAFSFVWFQTLLGANDPELYDGLVAGEVAYTDPRVEEVMLEWKEMIDAGWMSDSTSSIPPQTQLANGSIAMLPFGSFYAADLAGEGLDLDEWGIFTIPAGSEGLDPPTLFFETGALVASADQPNTEQIRQWLTWWTSADAQQVWADQLGDVSVNPQVQLADPEYTELRQDTTDFDLRLRFYEAVPTEVRTAVLDGLSAFMVNPDNYQRVLSQIEDVNAAYWAEQEDQ